MEELKVHNQLMYALYHVYIYMRHSLSLLLLYLNLATLVISPLYAPINPLAGTNRNAWK